MKKSKLMFLVLIFAVVLMLSLEVNDCTLSRCLR
jgi:hypothetical protein